MSGGILAIVGVALALGVLLVGLPFYYLAWRKPKGWIEKDAPVRVEVGKPLITGDRRAAYHLKGVVDTRPSRKASSDAIYGKGPVKVRPKAVPARVYHLPRGLTRSEAFRRARRMDPDRAHAAFTYDKRTGVAHSVAEAVE